MNLFDVYPLYNLAPVSAKGCTITDEKGIEYLDLYGGHAVISVGHSHPHYVQRISDQLKRIGFYSNSVQNPMQSELAQKLGCEVLVVPANPSGFYESLKRGIAYEC